jgi:cyclopropane fatty-acyl-phospholipid synthase-like methyltransferase
VILLKSVFTHLRPAEVENYLKEVARLLKADGRCLAPFFLLNQEQELLAAKASNTPKFSYGDRQWRYSMNTVQKVPALTMRALFSAY